MMMLIYWFHHWIFVCCLDAARCHQCLSNLVFNLNPVQIQYFEIFENLLKKTFRCVCVRGCLHVKKTSANQSKLRLLLYHCTDTVVVVCNNPLYYTATILVNVITLMRLECAFRSPPNAAPRRRLYISYCRHCDLPQQHLQH